MSRSRVATNGRELTLSLLVLVLLGLTGSASRVPAEVSPPTQPDPINQSGPAADPTRRPARSPAASAGPPTRSRAAAAPSVRIVGTAPRRPPRVSTDDQPAQLEMAALDLSLPIKPVGVTRKGEMELPDTITKVGWYRFGANPSSVTGTTVLAAHVDTRAEGLGPFAGLREVEVGAQVSVTDEDGDRHDYRVAKVQQTAKAKINWTQVFDETRAPRLVLITCGGAYDQESGYRDNVLVTAFPSS